MSSEKPKIVNESLFRSSEWDDYPMKRDDKHTNKIIEPDFMPLSDVSKPDALPNGYVFSEFTFDEANMIKLCAFINSSKDPEPSPLFSVSHLKWVLIPGSIVVTVNVSSSDKIVGSVCARPIIYRVDGRVINTFEVGWLCTLKELRGKRLASMLMKELYRRVYVLQRDCGIIFATTRQLPSLPLVNGVSLLKRSLTVTGASGGVEATKNLDLLRFANMRDVSRMMKIYRSYAVDAKKWRLYREYTRREFEHTFLRRSDVTTYVIRTDRGDVKDFISLTTNVSNASNVSNADSAKTGHIHFVSFVNDKLLEIFLQNVLHILAKNGYSAVYIEDVNGVSEVCRSKLGFECVQTKWYYQFNYNTKTISLEQSQFITHF